MQRMLTERTEHVKHEACSRCAPACQAWSLPRDDGGCHAGAGPTTHHRWGTGPHLGGRSALVALSEEPDTQMSVSRLAYIQQHDSQSRPNDRGAGEGGGGGDTVRRGVAHSPYSGHRRSRR